MQESPCPVLTDITSGHELKKYKTNSPEVIKNQFKGVAYFYSSVILLRPIASVEAL